MIAVAWVAHVEGELLAEVIEGSGAVVGDGDHDRGAVLADAAVDLGLLGGDGGGPAPLKTGGGSWQRRV